MALKLIGIDNVLANLNKELQNIKGRSLKGLIRASIILRNSMEKDVPRIPVDTSNLRASWFVAVSDGSIANGKSSEFNTKEKSGERVAREHIGKVQKHMSFVQGPIPAIIMGFTAYYALPVHENIGAQFKAPGAGAKFFEVHLQTKQKQMLEMIQKEVQIK